MLTEERLLFEGGRPRRDIRCATGVGGADEWYFGDKGILICCQDEPKVVFLVPATGTLD